MIFLKRIKERIKLLEYENEILFEKIESLEKLSKHKPKPEKLFPRLIRDGGWDLSYKTLKKKYRK